ncbi:hypothetical protein H6P81_004974 [Aristolochia fimbriata]|uniref:NusB/RsmB/TIM44 domain-containing protein n=1 Tax=Aristolochia fimbriata TaxID=158543 RepID=A0AAV7ET61_ARIFI|nr:hypothetical protein H6P81_004974 [Aristolochia fimbriata]
MRYFQSTLSSRSCLAFEFLASAAEMEAASALNYTHFSFNFCKASSSSKTVQIFCCNPKQSRGVETTVKNRITSSVSRHSIRPSFAVAEALEQAPVSDTSSSAGGVSSKLDKSGRFCSPRAAREHALLILYAACLDGAADPVRLFDKRVNAKRVPGYTFDKASLLEYNHMKFSGAPVSVDTEEEEAELTLIDEQESANEAEVLSAPPKLVYSRFVLRLTRELLEGVADKWEEHILAINKITPPAWKDEPAGRILELCILHLAMAEMVVKGTRHQIVINEAVDLAKRFCDGTAPRVINGCLRTFVKSHKANELAQALETNGTQFIGIIHRLLPYKQMQSNTEMHWAEMSA